MQNEACLEFKPQDRKPFVRSHTIVSTYHPPVGEHGHGLSTLLAARRHGSRFSQSDSYKSSHAFVPRQV